MVQNLQATGKGNRYPIWDKVQNGGVSSISGEIIKPLLTRTRKEKNPRGETDKQRRTPEKMSQEPREESMKEAIIMVLDIKKKSWETKTR